MAEAKEKQISHAEKAQKKGKNKMKLQAIDPRFAESEIKALQKFLEVLGVAKAILGGKEEKKIKFEIRLVDLPGLLVEVTASRFGREEGVSVTRELRESWRFLDYESPPRIELARDSDKSLSLPRRTWNTWEEVFTEFKKIAESKLGK